jgi:2-dehydropantoate 2-reductase
VSKTLATLDALPADTTSSMQRDIMAGRPSELEAQTGAVVRFGRKTGVPTPVHDAIYAELLPLEERARASA